MKRSSKFSNKKVDSSGEPYKVVPKAQRLKIYKQIFANENLSSDSGMGLCILLARYAGYNFIKSPDSDCLFPEFGEHIEKYSPIKWDSLFNNDRKKWRRAVLESCIELCK